MRVVRDLFTDEEFKGLVTDSRRVYDKIDGVPVRGRARPRAEGLDARGPAAGLRGAPHRRADPQGAGPEGVAPVGRLPRHRAHRGDDGHRRQHRQARRQGEPRGDRHEDEPRGRRARSRGSFGCATSAGSSSSTSSTCSWRRTRSRSRTRCARRSRTTRRVAGVRHRAARPDGGDPQAGIRAGWSSRSRRPARPARAGASSSPTTCADPPGLDTKGTLPMYAVIKTGGKQHKVQAGDVIEVELIGRRRDGDVHPAARRRRRRQDPRRRRPPRRRRSRPRPSARQKGDKVKVFKYRPKTGYSKKTGHRQQYTLIEISDVSLG